MTLLLLLFSAFASSYQKYRLPDIKDQVTASLDNNPSHLISIVTKSNHINVLLIQLRKQRLLSTFLLSL